jgi:hypothetical protein
MRLLLGFAAAFALAIGLAAPASAASVPFSGSLAVQIGTLPPIPVSGSGTATVNGSAGGHPITSLTIPASAFSTSLTVAVPNAFPIVQLAFPVLANGPISVASGGGCTAGHPNLICPGTGLAGFGGVVGTALVGIFFTHTAGSGSGSQPVANLSVPLGVVGAGSTTLATSLGITVQVSGAGWTTGTASVFNPTAQVLTHNPSTFHQFPTVTFTASQSIPVPGSTGTLVSFAGTRSTNPTSNFNTDTITLVSPIQIFNNATSAFIPSLASVSLHFIPEPGQLLMLGSGLAALLLYGRRRMRK